MSNEKDEDLDKLFKKGLEDPVSEPAFRDADWDAMERMLDKGKKRPAIIFWLPVIGSAAALILIFLGYLFFKPEVVKPGKKEQMAVVNKADTNSANKTKNNTGTSGEPARKGADSSKQQTQTTAQYAVKPSPQSHGQKSNSFFTLSSGKDRRNATGQDKNKAANGSKTNNIQPNGIGDQPVIANNTAAGKTQLGVADSKTQLGTADSKTALGTADDQKQKDNTDNILASKTQLGTADSKTQLGTADQKPKVNAAGTLASATVTTPSGVKVGNKQTMGNHPQFAVSVWASSDLNGVNSAFQQSKIGGNFGGAFSVTFAQKWTISTGATYDIKPYLTNFNNYHTAYQFKTQPTSVNANCRMLEVPLNVNYQVYRQRANKITLGTGLSSYFMLREDYKFNYAADPYNNNNTGGPTHYTVINKNRNILSVLNLDATYTHQLNSKVGVILQPYLKVPLTDVGASQVRLQSSGVALGFSWNLNASSKPK